ADRHGDPSSKRGRTPDRRQRGGNGGAPDNTTRAARALWPRGRERGRRLTVGLIVRMTVIVLRSRSPLVELPQGHALARGSFCPSIEVERERVAVEHDALI